ncbi:transcriptional regulator [Mycobacteroides abscessus]|uniref:IclR family transcriptional regulator n=1 Tax=Mycobacteroides abscessus TaxID=36809 RepID=UPI0002D83776|nr:IclR family transcriptional regulator [Mycobacteroides abscessus]CPT65792.1 transcriptional regulator [Mycobacteroides abscessus]CPU59519.1 transcriptional regulator [Mycobacteroides abscessus]SKJ89747.1 transcriptional regulator [Mycobacteroides abscessus subsp. massiliense]SKP96848.1 transcriptional regulator [Mycobacteroides abscessus subsp. massiliense]SKV60985.1 transcriptional regulator [Mycobacteroides abscessus subsp. massiliense]
MTAVLDSVRDDRAAVDKAFSLLVAFGAEASTGVGVSELARRASLSKSTAYRVLGMLERNAMVERIGTDYRLGSRLHELGLAVYAPSHERVRDQLMPFLTELFDATRQTVHLAMLHGTDVVYLAKLYGHRNAVTPSRVGGRLPAHCTAVGKVLLAYDATAEDKILSGRLTALTSHSITDGNELARALDRVRREGVAIEREESRPGLGCVAAPVFGRNGLPIAAMSVSVPVSADLRPLTHSLRRVCASASRTVGQSHRNG